jgi:tetratricopeptide (TPR) repeat protein
MNDYRTLARLFHLPEVADHHVVTTMVNGWFHNNENWLLILDNVEDLNVLQRMAPRNTNRGHILITTRTQTSAGVMRCIDLQKMDTTEGALLLLRRAQLSTHASLDNSSTLLRSQAMLFVELVDGLPLALDQAGAYIEDTACSLSDYLELYQNHRKKLLDTRGPFGTHPASVAATLSLAFQKVEHEAPFAADVLRVCAFLAPDAIPEELVMQSLSTDSLTFHEAMRILRQFSLIRRDPQTHTLSVHRIVQIILKEEMDMQAWSQRIGSLIQALLHLIPDYKMTKNFDVQSQLQLQHYLPHAISCVSHIKERSIYSEHVEIFFYRLAVALQLWGEYEQAKSFNLYMLRVLEERFGEKTLKSAPFLNLLAVHASGMGEYREAEAYFHQAVALCEEGRGRDHPDIAENFWGLADLYNHQGRYQEAERYAQRALVIQEHHFGPGHHEVAWCLNILARSLLFQKEYAHAEILLKRAIHIYEQTFGKDHLFIGACSCNLAALHTSQKNYAKAATLYEKALRIYELKMGPYNLNIADIAQKLGHFYFDQAAYDQAHFCYQKASKIYQRFSEQEQANLEQIRTHEGLIALLQGQQSLAQEAFQEITAFLGERAGVNPSSPECTLSEDLLCCLLIFANRLDTEQARSYLQRALALSTQLFGPNHPLTLRCQTLSIEEEH